MRFFTDRTVKNEYLLIKIKDYLKQKKYKRWKEVFIDPEVYDLIKSKFYSWEKKTFQETSDFIINFLDKLPKNHYFSWDYPSDMNLKYTDHFLERSWNNAIHFCHHPQYIVTVQSKFNHYWSFTKWFDRYNNLSIESGILGIGNLCRILYLDDYMKHVLGYIFRFCKHPRIHIYGLGLRSIPHAYNLAMKYNKELSIDSVKWTRPCTVELKKKCGLWFKHEYRQNCFDAYLEEIQKRGVELKNITEVKIENS